MKTKRKKYQNQQHRELESESEGWLKEGGDGGGDISET